MTHGSSLGLKRGSFVLFFAGSPNFQFFGLVLVFFMTMLSELPLVSQVTKYLDGCSCARASKEEVAAIKAELDQKDTAIERLETEIRQKDLEKDNLMTMQKVLQEQISQIRADLEAQSEEQQSMMSEVTPYNVRPAPVAAPAAQPPAKAAAKAVPAPIPTPVPSRRPTQESLAPAPSRRPTQELLVEAPQLGGTLAEREAAITRMQARQRGKLDRRKTAEKMEVGEMAGQKRSRKKTEDEDLAAQRMQARVRGGADRKAVEERKAAGDLPGQPRLSLSANEAGAGGEASAGGGLEAYDDVGEEVPPPPPFSPSPARTLAPS